MTQKTVRARAIQAGYEWRLRLTVSGVGAFPAGATFRAQVRRDASQRELLATMATASGTIERQGEQSFDLILPGVASKGWPEHRVLIDVVRTDLPTHQHLGFRISVPVVAPITQDG